MNPDPRVKPFLKWAGGKRQLLSALLEHVPAGFDTYFEPFIGGGALLFALQPSRAVINDSNAELTNCYSAVRDHLEPLLAALACHRNDTDYYYALRDWDRSPDYPCRAPAQRAARIIALNKTCYNGLFRVNAQGAFNVPFGRYTNPKILDRETLEAVSAYLRRVDLTIRTGDFGTAVHDAGTHDFVYFDPPYDPLSDTSSFTGYDLKAFVRPEQLRLKALCDNLTARGTRFLLSNAATPFIAELYKDYRTIRVQATRAINSLASRRGAIDEFLILNYGE